jgi:hypothetical protein
MKVTKSGVCPVNKYTNPKFKFFFEL